jgi:hypothetical protein
MSLASMKCWQMVFAMGLGMEKVVVVVVVTMREASLGSVVRLDWEKRRDARLAAASSVVKEFGYDLKKRVCVESSSETIKVANKSCVSCQV